MPEISYKTLDEIPEGLREGAKNEDGVFKVNVVLNSKLQEFRNTNIAVRQELEDLQTKYNKLAPLVGDDLDKFVSEIPELRKTAQQVADGKLKGSDQIEREIDGRIAGMKENFAKEKKDLQTLITNLQASDAKWKGMYERSVLDQQITNAVIAADSVANPNALPDILARAANLFIVGEDGSVVPKRNGETVYGADGVSPMTPKEWLTKLVADAPYLGKASVGGGATGGKGGPESHYGMSREAFESLHPQERIRLARAAAKKG